MTQLVRVGKIFILLLLILWFGLWILAEGFLDRTENWAQGKVANVAADMGLRIKNVDVEGRHYLPVESLKEIIAVHPGDPLLAVDLDHVKNELQKNPWVKDVSIRRALPDRIVINLIERQPLAIWLDAPGTPGVIDEDGVVLAQTGFEQFGPLLAVSGPDSEKQAANLMALLSAQPDVAVRIQKAVYISGRRWDLVMDGGTIVKLPEEDAGLSLARLSRAQEETKILDQGHKSVDLRQADRIILENKPGDIRDLLLKDAPPV
ncbi:MAG TPA: FtsQ-type POTRA domain-containing protein [Alphaproteobacteria bacterium]